MFCGDVVAEKIHSAGEVEKTEKVVIIIVRTGHRSKSLYLASNKAIFIFEFRHPSAPSFPFPLALLSSNPLPTKSLPHIQIPPL